MTSSTDQAPAQSGAGSTAQTELASTLAQRLHTAIGSVIEGKPEVASLAVTVLLAEGHLLIEDVPGVGKTMLAKALARSIDGSVKRIQFTPDLMPSDVTGVSIFNQQSREFEFQPGAIFANIVVGDEINRASPKTQSALLEAMEEKQVTVDGRTIGLNRPFMVVATQNPIEMEGTYPLPEAQRDRFMMRVAMGYPSLEAERKMIEDHAGLSTLAALEPVTDAETVAQALDVVRSLYVSDPVKDYAVAITAATRRSPELRLGASPRATLHLVRAARARAAIDGRGFVLPDDIHQLAVPVLTHRLLPTAEAQIGRRDAATIVTDILAAIPAPEADRSRR